VKTNAPEARNTIVTRKRGTPSFFHDARVRRLSSEVLLPNIYERIAIARRLAVAERD
jgi:hypothetical protein